MALSGLVTDPTDTPVNPVFSELIMAGNEGAFKAVPVLQVSAGPAPYALCTA
jgi:hypothetical protein